MERKITTIPRIKVSSSIPRYSPAPDTIFVSENDPAIRVMTDFKIVTPITIEPIVSIDVAIDKMRVAGVRLLFVTDDSDNIGGVITSYDIQGEKPIKYSQEHDLGHDQIRVEMIMVPLEDMPAFDYDFVKQSVVRHVVTTIQELERPHALVIEFDEKHEQQKLRGMFSSSQIRKLLGKGVYSPLHAADSLADMQRDMEHPTI